jgi:putative membrane protein insertion efficiency factor
VKQVLMLPVRVYRALISPCKPRCCRFEPSCSQYALEALHRHGALRGSWLSVRRLLRCHPFTEPAYDPVPDAVPDAVPPPRDRAARP